MSKLSFSVIGAQFIGGDKKSMVILFSYLIIVAKFNAHKDKETALTEVSRWKVYVGDEHL